MAEERTYTIPLRKEFGKVKDYQRAKKAVKATREFLIRHTKAEDVKIGKYLHEKIMSRGRMSPPPRVQVRVWKDGEKTMAELIGAPEEKEPAQEEKKAGKKPTEKITEGAKPKEEAQKEKEAKEKEQVLEHEKVEHKERHTVGDEIQPEKKVMEKERHMRIKTHSQKPTHEKKK